jgi:hypothetical protein
VYRLTELRPGPNGSSTSGTTADHLDDLGAETRLPPDMRIVDLGVWWHIERMLALLEISLKRAIDPGISGELERILAPATS